MFRRRPQYPSALDERAPSMTIAFVIGGLGVGGAERQLTVLASTLSDRGHRVLVVTTSDGVWRDTLEAHGVDVRNFPAGSLWARLRQRCAIVATLRRERVDVLHPYLTSTNAWVTLCAPVIAPRLLVWGVRDSGTQVVDGIKSRAAWALSRHLSRSADVVIFNSEAGARNYAGLGYRPRMSAVVPNGIDTDRFRPDPRLRSVWRAEHSVDASSLVVGMIARDDPVKGHEDLVAAAGHLRSVAGRLRDAVYVIAGGVGSERAARLVGMASGGGVDLRLLPASPEPESFYNGVDVFVLPSRRSEGFPNVLGEALACGCVAVATDVGDTRLLLDGSGFVVRPSDAADLAAGIERAVERIAEADRGALHRSVVERFSVGRLVDLTEALLQEQLGRHGAAPR